MGLTMAAKILGRASGRQDARTGDVLRPAVDLMTCLDGATFIDRFQTAEAVTR
ncbi:hypothetical protein ACWEQP_28185 [Streptomyces sp. NPDC004044]|uniref:hypothetical protein n=1 Tax=Streptomyces sp. NPDC005356 TaxID=3157167 RepID=UPI0033B83C2B